MMLPTHTSSLSRRAIPAISLLLNQPNKSTNGNAHTSVDYGINHWDTLVNNWLSVGEKQTFLRAFFKRDYTW